MAIAATASGRLSIAQLALREGVHTGTVWRWILTGIKGVKLEANYLGGRRYVTESNWQTFCARLNTSPNGSKGTSHA